LRSHIPLTKHLDGQTGSGKTFTITGGAESYDDRGIIPRAISHVFDRIEADEGAHTFAVHISYLEIYNGSGYDLLDPKHETKKLEELPKVLHLVRQPFHPNCAELR
jgi:kinesin family protein 6/9